jgi:hypothetical protein
MKVRADDLATLPADYNWQEHQDRIDAAAKRQADAVWRRKCSRRHHKKQHSKGRGK